MIKQIKIELTNDNSEIRPSYNWAYNLYGALMEKIDAEYAELLHLQGLKPISHYLEVISQGEEKQTIWNVNLLGAEAVETLTPIIEGTEKYFIEKYNTELKVAGIRSETTITEMEFVEKYFLGQNTPRRLDIFHVTPCSFRSNEQYVIFPSVELIIKSAVQKWNAFARETVINDPEAITQIIDYTRISSYNLNSSGYTLKENRIPAFLGRTSLSVRGPESMAKLFNLLIRFLEFSGLGIKASLGMGGCRIL